MMIIKFILAGIAVASVAGWPRSRAAAFAALAAGALSGGIFAATVAAAPMLVFLTAALGLAWLADRAGLVDWAVSLLARAGRGSTLRLYALVCSVAALLTAIVSLDGAVVLMVPVVSLLTRRHRIGFAPFFLGVIAVTNAASLAVPEGNPTNLVVMERLGLSPEAFLLHLSLPGICAASLAAMVPARHLRRRRYALCSSGEETETRRRLIVPARIGMQLIGLLAALQGFVPPLSAGGHQLAGLLVIAVAAGGLSALANNLPVSAAVATFLSGGPAAYAALIGLTVGAFATRHGSVATMIADELGAEDAELPLTTLGPASGLAVLGATLCLWAIVSS
jgi:Na+/H+ antiporter NhaD/arsenite permease-like protein